jgi:hypothetical protein
MAPAGFSSDRRPRAPPASAAPPWPGFVGRTQSWRTTSDAPCRAPRPPETRMASRNQNRFHRPHVNASGLSRPRAPFLDRCPQERRFRSCSPICGSPPPISRFCHRRSGFRHSFTLSSLSREGARPIVGSADSSSTVARGHAPPVDFCNRFTIHEHNHGGPYPTEPRQRSPTDAADPMNATFRSRSWAAGGNASCEARPAESSRARGLARGSCLDALAPPISIARDGSFAPTRSTRTPPVAARCVFRLETPVSRSQSRRNDP